MFYPLKSDGSFCGGVVGATGEKMCVKRSCTVAKHKTKVEVIPICDRESESGQYVYISDKEDEVVFVKSVIPMKLLPNPFSFYDYEYRKPAHWGQLFRLLQATDEDIESRSEEALKVLIGSSHKAIMGSPWKRPKPNDEEDRDPETADQDRNFQLARLANIIGSHPDGMGPDTILSQLAAHGKRLEDTSSSLSEREQKDLALVGSLFAKHGSDLSQLKLEVVSESQVNIFTQMAPLFEWFGKWTAQPHNEGDPPGPIAGELDAKLDAMESAIQRLQQTANSRSSSTQQPSQLPWAGVPSPSRSLSRAPGSQSQGDVESKMKSMQFQLDLIEEQIGGEQITIAGTTFRSAKEFKTW